MPPVEPYSRRGTGGGGSASASGGKDEQILDLDLLWPSSDDDQNDQLYLTRTHSRGEPWTANAFVSRLKEGLQFAYEFVDGNGSVTRLRSAWEEEVAYGGMETRAPRAFWYARKGYLSMPSALGEPTKYLRVTFPRSSTSSSDHQAQAQVNRIAPFAFFELVHISSLTSRLYSPDPLARSRTDENLYALLRHLQDRSARRQREIVRRLGTEEGRMERWRSRWEEVGRWEQERWAGAMLALDRLERGTLDELPLELFET